MLADQALRARRIDPSDPSRELFVAQAFGLRWSSDHPLVQFRADEGSGPPDVQVRRVDSLRDRAGGRVVNNGVVFADGARFRFGDAVFDTFGGDRVDWWCPQGHEMPNAFYGTVAAIILAWRGLVPLHGSSVEIGGRAIMVVGPSGAGKSTLCHALVERGGRLVSDDLTAMMPMTGPGEPLLQPGRPAIRLVSASGPVDGDKLLHRATSVDPCCPVPLAAMVVLGDPPIPPGPAHACEMLTRQLFRPQWMSALPFRRERAATLLHAAPQIVIFSAPAATVPLAMPVGDKAERVMAHFASIISAGSKVSAVPRAALKKDIAVDRDLGIGDGFSRA